MYDAHNNQRWKMPISQVCINKMTTNAGFCNEVYNASQAT